MGTLLSALIPAAASLVLSAPASAQVTFSGPLGTSGVKLHAPAETSQFPLVPYGYTEQEYLASGTAQGNTAGYPQNQAYPALPFTTRIIVRRPEPPPGSRASGAPTASPHG